MMTQIEELKLMNYSTIEYLKKTGLSYERNSIIKEILKDETCFFKLDKEDAYIILQDIGLSGSELASIYSKLISRDTFFDLLRDKKIDENSNELKIKYKTYNSNIFEEDKKKIDDEEKNIIKYKESIFTKLHNWIRKFLKR